MASKKVIVVGNGLFGSIAATLARSRGHEVTVISDMQPLAASKASGCVLAPSWLLSIPKEQVTQSMDLLDQLYGLEKLDFFNPQLKTTFGAHRIDPDKVRVKADLIGKVEQVGDGFVVSDHGKHSGIVLLATGYWTPEFVPGMKMRGLYGASVRFEAHLAQPLIHVYAPYRQAVGFQLNRKEVWFGDGTALIRKTWEAERTHRIAATVERGNKLMHFKPGLKARVNEGVRPYVEGHKEGYFDRIHPRTWVSTGGAKNGTVLAAANALRFIAEARL